MYIYIDAFLPKQFLHCSKQELLLGRLAVGKNMFEQRISKRHLQWILLVLWLAWGAHAQQGASPIQGVDSVEMTVADMDRSIQFYPTVLTFEKSEDLLISSGDYRKLEGVPKARARIVRMRLGNEFIELTQYLTPQGRSRTRNGF